MRVRRPDEFRSSPRRLTLRHSRRQWNNLTGQRRDDGNLPPPPALEPGQEQLYSFYKSGLEAGTHHISVTQTLDTDPKEVLHSQLGSKTLNSLQQFNVIQPQYSLPKDAIHSFYPPEGHADEARILPHVLLNDPLLAWERQVTTRVDSDACLNRYPWLAVLVFSTDELKLADTDLNGLKQQKTGTVQVNFETLSSMNHLAITPVDLASNPSQVADFIFVDSRKFGDLFSDYDANGNIIASPQPVIKRYKYLAHSRNINMKGMASSSGGDDDIGMFGVVLAHQTGPWDKPALTSMVAHLVSIEGIDPTESTSNITLPVAQPRVALCSLFSWTYTVLPAYSLNVYDAMLNLSTTMNVLSLDSASIADLTRLEDPVSKRVGLRMQDGYTLACQKAQTGESTVALVRGPFTPNIQEGETFSQFQSTFATDLQVLDKELGIMDISYSLAWQLGKSMAIADMAFSGALSRLRTAISNGAMQAAMKDVLSEANAKYASSKRDVASSITQSMKKLRELPDWEVQGDAKLRWSRQKHAAPNMNFWSQEIRQRFAVHSTRVAKELGQSIMDNPQNPGVKMLYNEHNTPASADWAIVLAWLMNGLYLIGVPAHYLIPDTCYLPRESLRFFAIDSNWTEAFIDGALSVANHKEGDQDTTRVAIKNAFYNEYLKQVDPVLGYQPLVPTFGCLMRSQIVTKFPDLRVQAARADKNDPRPELLRHEIIADDTMMILFDRTPSSVTDPLTTLVFSQPPHQQRFAAADNVGPDPFLASKEVTFNLGLKQVYTGNYSQWPPLVPNTDKQFFQKDGVFPLFDWERRCLIVSNFADYVFQYDQANMGGIGYHEDFASAALVAFQLNDPLIVITVNVGGKDSVVKQAFSNVQPPRADRHRQLTMNKCRDQFKTEAKVEAWRTRRATLLDSHKKASQDTKQQLLHHKQEPESHVTAKHSIPSPYPNFRSVQKLPFSTKEFATLSYQSQFEIHIRSRDQTKPNFISRADYASDLIFSVTRKDPTVNNTWQLDHFEIEIELGSATDTDKPRIMSSYGGFGCRMLSNLRFNPLAAQWAPSTSLKLLRIALYPRSTNGWTALGTSPEAGFILSEARINQFEWNTKFTYNFWEYYDGDDGVKGPNGKIIGQIHVEVEGKNGPAHAV